MAGKLPQNRGNKTTSRVGTTMSRKLRAAGWNISPSARKHRYDGIFVSAQGDHVCILVDLGVDQRNREGARQMAAQLVGWDCVPDVVRVSESPETGACFIQFTYQH